MKGDHMGTNPTNPSPQELSFSNWTWFSLGEQKGVTAILALLIRCRIRSSTSIRAAFIVLGCRDGILEKARCFAIYLFLPLVWCSSPLPDRRRSAAPLMRSFIAGRWASRRGVSCVEEPQWPALLLGPGRR